MRRRSTSRARCHWQPQRDVIGPVQSAAIEPGNDPMREQDKVEEPQSQRSWSAARPHALLKKPAIEHRKSGNENRDEDRPVKPKDQDSETASRTEQGGRCGNQQDRGAKIG